MLDTRPAGVSWRYATNKKDIKPSAEFKKCLFGAPDHEELKEDLKQQIGEMQQADRLRWNYDFKRDTPLPGGRYKWEKIPVGTNIDKGEDSTDSGRETGSELDSPSTSLPIRDSSISESPSTHQRSLADFFRLKKRFSPSTASDEPRIKRLRSSPSGLEDLRSEKPSVSRSLTTHFRPISNPDS